MPKKKGDKGGNPNPVQTDKFIDSQIGRTEGDPYSHIPLTKKLQVRMYDPVVNAIEKMPDKERVIWLRRIITEAAIKELGASMPETD